MDQPFPCCMLEEACISAIVLSLHRISAELSMVRISSPPHVPPERTVIDRRLISTRPPEALLTGDQICHLTGPPLKFVGIIWGHENAG